MSNADVMAAQAVWELQKLTKLSTDDVKGAFLACENAEDAALLVGGYLRAAAPATLTGWEVFGRWCLEAGKVAIQLLPLGNGIMQAIDAARKL